MLALGALFARILYRALRTGIVSNRTGTYRRNKDPFNYWMTVFALAFFIVVMVVAAWKAFGG